ncbi:fimbrial protein [Rouxiella sp. Mn2063]|uniref:fimbrial protein n=1 Tax=Rouxiella sp. Mn2063 TaxID=3395262 RepID=UPI003BC9F7EE
MTRFQGFLFALSTAMPFIQSHAADNMKFSGTLIEPPICTINHGNKIDVDFKTMGIRKVDGVNNLMTIDYELHCESNASTTWDMTLEIIATATDYDVAAIKTDVTYLGIRILENDKPFELNKPISISADKPVILKAVPVKKPGFNLEPKPFSATATLLAVYQ